MTTTLSPTQVRCRDDGLLTARCTRCGTEFVQAVDADVRTALLELDRDHPSRSHAPGVPAGWRPAEVAAPG